MAANPLVEALKPKLDKLGEGIEGLGEDGMGYVLMLLATDQTAVLKFGASIVLLAESLEKLGEMHPELGLTETPTLAKKRGKKSGT